MLGNNRSCDQCYAQKKKCQRQEDLAGCTRCVNLSLDCSTVRHRRLPGRPARSKVLGPAGRVQVWRSKKNSHGFEAAQEERLAQSSPQSSATDARSSSPDHVSTASKESYSAASDDETNRLLLSLGSKWLNPEESAVLTPASREFYALHNIFMIGPTFAEPFRRALEYSRSKTPELLQDTFLAMDKYVEGARSNSTAPAEEIARVAGLLKKLQATSIVNADEALAIFILGQSLAAFDTFVVSTGSMLILRHSLFLVKPWYPQLAQVEFLDSVTILPLFWDILGCLFKREVPIIRPQIYRPLAVDRIAGLCVSLMPMLYELCEVSYEIKSQSQPRTEKLERIEAEVRSWAPNPASLKTLRFTNTEKSALQAQAAMYRSAILLLIHRLIHPLSCQDGVAVSHANDILAERDKLLADGGPNMKLQYVCFPLFLALLEIPLRPESLWQSVTRLPICPACADQFFAFHKYFWQQRWGGFTGYLFDLMDKGPSFVAVP
ncbi:hypothetical protein N7462_010344 [Penicillium macrosclerotiorum]|uniref:uncharacterized protein n=1 Tax=Penicillium macrosclerotiorum TaxID=303699 RepID=UPI00254903DA|nr:uncharacterized protein N7462_010344 [Penicillium macrosclerotiorum]KAJ5669274.1 hypothetical protein N7462_010344 [Penicillium macrosclerotiorum]